VQQDEYLDDDDDYEPAALDDDDEEEYEEGEGEGEGDEREVKASTAPYTPQAKDFKEMKGWQVVDR
jgi:hypothetical protein